MTGLTQTHRPTSRRSRRRRRVLRKAGYDGVSVDEHLATSVLDIFTAGDIARWPDRYSGGRIRVEHWVMAQRQAQVAALNMMGHCQSYIAVPFFWTERLSSIGRKFSNMDGAAFGQDEPSGPRLQMRDAGATGGNGV